MAKKKVTGIGGVFFKCDDPVKMREWYAQKLGMITTEYGAPFEWRQAENPEKSGYTSWSTFSKESTYFEPSKKEFMINYRVADLAALLEELKAEGVPIVGEIQSFDYGKFAHILDPEGNKIELWEPKDEVFDDFYKGKTNK